jgi:hypothetical protein
MKYVRMLGLAAMVAMALMAFGAVSASAASHLYSTGVQVPAGTEFHATLEGSGVLASTDTKTIVDTCSASTIAGKVVYPAGEDATIAISSLTWGGCSVTTDTLTNGELTISSSGAVTGNSSVITINLGVSGRYGTGGGTLLGTLSTGRISINAIINELAPCFICPDTMRWEANYTVTTPHDLTAGA